MENCSIDLCKAAVTSEEEAMEASKEIEDIIDLSQTRDDTIQECSQKDGREGQVFTFPTQEVEIFNIKGWKGYANKFFDTDEEIQLSPKSM